MRNPADLHTGDDWTPAITLKVDDSAYAVPSGATVRAAITDQDGINILAGPVTVLEATSGSDWGNGVIVPIFPAAQTVDLPTGYARTEVEVFHDGNVSTWSLSRTPRIEPGTITNLTIEPAPGETLADINAAELGSGAATDGYVLTADGSGGAAWEAGPTTALPVPFVNVASSKTLALSDSEVEQRVNSASAVVLTIPTNAAAAYADNAKIPVMGIGTGTVTITASAGVTINGVSAGSAALTAQYSPVVLTKVGTDAWVVNGDHGAVA